MRSDLPPAKAKTRGPEQSGPKPASSLSPAMLAWIDALAEQDAKDWLAEQEALKDMPPSSPGSETRRSRPKKAI